MFRVVADTNVYVSALARAGREREGGARGALAALQEVESKRRVQYTGGRKVKGEPRGSVTDPETCKMRMANGGFRPGYNVQFATDAVHGALVRGSVANSGSDSDQAPAMVEQIERRTGGRRTTSQALRPCWFCLLRR